MLTATGNKLEHRFALQAAVRGGIVQGHHTAGASSAGAGWTGWEGGGVPSQPASQPPSTV